MSHPLRLGLNCVTKVRFPGKIPPVFGTSFKALELSPPIVPKSELERLEQIDPDVDEVGGSDEESRADWLVLRMWKIHENSLKLGFV